MLDVKGVKMFSSTHSFFEQLFFILCLFVMSNYFIIYFEIRTKQKNI